MKGIIKEISTLSYHNFLMTKKVYSTIEFCSWWEILILEISDNLPIPQKYKNNLSIPMQENTNVVLFECKSISERCKILRSFLQDFSEAEILSKTLSYINTYSGPEKEVDSVILFGDVKNQKWIIGKEGNTYPDDLEHYIFYVDGKIYTSDTNKLSYEGDYPEYFNMLDKYEKDKKGYYTRGFLGIHKYIDLKKLFPGKTPEEIKNLIKQYENKIWKDHNII